MFDKITHASVLFSGSLNEGQYGRPDAGFKFIQNSSLRALQFKQNVSILRQF
jgi:hypothetical protein